MAVSKSESFKYFLTVELIKSCVLLSRVVYILRPPVSKKEEGISLIFFNYFKTAS